MKKNLWQNRSFQVWLRWSIPLTTIHFIILGIITKWQFPVVERILWYYTKHSGEVWQTLPGWLQTSRLWYLVLCPLFLGFVLILKKWFENLSKPKKINVIVGCIVGFVCGFHSGLIAVFGVGLLAVFIFGFVAGLTVGFTSESGAKLGIGFGVSLGAGFIVGPVAGFIAGFITLVGVGLGTGFMVFLSWAWRSLKLLVNHKGWQKLWGFLMARNSQE